MRRFGCATASPSYSLSTPAMMRNRVDFPEPFSPSTPIFAPGKKLSEIFFRIVRLGGTIFPTRCMVYTYWAMDARASVAFSCQSAQLCCNPAQPACNLSA
jgi:hypothetical protein